MRPEPRGPVPTPETHCERLPLCSFAGWHPLPSLSLLLTCIFSACQGPCPAPPLPGSILFCSPAVTSSLDCICYLCHLFIIYHMTLSIRNDCICPIFPTRLSGPRGEGLWFTLYAWLRLTSGIPFLHCFKTRSKPPPCIG